MLELLQSNRMQLLLETLCERLQQPDDPFEPTLVVVQSQGIGQWLKVELANRLGIAANIECLLPAELIWRLYQRVLPTDIPDESPFSRHLMTWRLMQLLPESAEPSIQQYLSAGSDAQLRLYQLSHVIAGLFDQYLIYRPDWIEAWDTEDAELSWQSELWRRLLQEPGMDPSVHRANLHKAFVRRVRSGDASLPKEINVLGVSSLPAMHLETLQVVAEQETVSIYFLNPSEHYWGDIASEKDVAKKSIRRLLGKEGPLVEDDYLEVGNPLLSSTGKQGREFLELLLEVDSVNAVDLFQPVNNDSMLGLIHSDLLSLEFGGEFYDGESKPEPRQIDAQDYSIQIHVAHSRMREVEILLDQTLTMIDRSNGAIQPADIMVMAPDISVYAPYIQAVFQNKLPFSITDRPAVDESVVLVAFNKLLALPDSRLTATEVMDLLEIPTIADRFELSESDVSRLQYWVREAGIRYEKDGHSKQEKWQLPGDDYNTWRFGLDRLLMGLAMEPTAGLYADTAPVEVSPGDAELIGTLCHIIDLLGAHRETLMADHAAAEWQTLIHRMIADLMLLSAEDEFSLAPVTDALSAIETETQQARFTDVISSRLFRYWLGEQLQQPPQNRGFVSGGITFATLVPMRSIPYPCICLLGMNDREFPREDKPLSFDLMAKQYRRGDRSRRNDDRYLFLEALLSAQQTFYVSYIGRGQKDNKEKPPSELVSELTDYLTRIYGSTPVYEHPLQPFNSIYYQQGSGLKSYTTNWYNALSNPSPPSPFVDQPISSSEKALTHLDQLTRFYRHPAKHYLMDILGVQFSEDDDALKDSESFDLDGLERYQLGDDALQTLLDQEPLEDWMALTRAAGHVLPGVMGEQQLKREVDLAECIAEAVAEHGGIERTQSQFSIPVGDYALAVDIPLFGDRHIVARTGTLRARQRIEAWIKHLALNIHQQGQETILISRGKNRDASVEKIPAIDPAVATNILAELANNYFSSEPLLFLPEASYELLSKGSLEDARKKFLGGQAGSELEDRYYNRLFELPGDINQQFEKTANQVWRPLFDHLEASK